MLASQVFNHGGNTLSAVAAGREQTLVGSTASRLLHAEDADTGTGSTVVVTEGYSNPLPGAKALIGLGKLNGFLLWDWRR